MDFPNRRQVAPCEVPRQPNQRRPQPPMYVSNLSADEPADQHVGRGAHGTREPDDLLSSGMPPPGPAYSSSHDCIVEILDETTDPFESDAGTLNDCAG